MTVRNENNKSRVRDKPAARYCAQRARACTTGQQCADHHVKAEQFSHRAYAIPEACGPKYNAGSWQLMPQFRLEPCADDMDS